MLNPVDEPFEVPSHHFSKLFIIQIGFGKVNLFFEKPSRGYLMQLINCWRRPANLGLSPYQIFTPWLKSRMHVGDMIFFMA